MALINCPECGKDISDQVKDCPHCGYPMKNKNGKTINLDILKIFKVNKKLAGIILGVLFIFAMITILFLSLNNNVEKAENYYKNDEYKAYQELSKEMKEDEINKFYKYLETEVDLIEGNFVNEKTSYNEAISQMERLIKYVNSSKVSNYESSLSHIKQLDVSRKSYLQAKEYEEKENYLDAYENYSKVVEDDKNYTNAQEKMNGMIELLINGYKESAENYAKRKNYSDAISDITNALKYLPDDEELVELKEKYASNKEKQDETKAEAERKAALLTDGKVIRGTEIIAEYQGAIITKSINPDNASGYYVYYTPNDDTKVYLDIKFRIKNISNDSKKLETIISNVKAIYNTNYTYNTYNCFYSDSSKIDTVYSWDTIDALSETTYHLAIIMPEEIAR